uniref:PX domain-containing protein n=1 Tax=Romanomermis culicivorax TaxID=13658 RepID=A0A915KII4_ROMCU
FLSENGGDAYIGLYLNLSSFNSATAQNKSSEVQDSAGYRAFVENMRETALNIYELYLSGQISDKAKFDKSLVERTLNNVNSSENIASWFEELQAKLFNILLTDSKFYPAFKKSETYLKLLTEIRLASQLDTGRGVDLETEATFMAEDALDSVSLRSVDSIGDVHSEIIDTNSKVDSVECQAEYTANIDTVALGNEGFALYNITANRHNDKGEILATWNIVRRYSDFYSLHNFVQQKFPALRILSFPGKKAFNNLRRDLWEKRKKSLNNYLKILLLPATLQQNKGLEVALMDFLCSKEYSSDKSTIANRISSFVFDPIKFGVKSFGNAVISMPDRVVDNVVRVGDNLGKVTKSVLGVMSSESSGALDDDEVLPSLGGRVGAQLDAAESSNNIPIRILLLCMDEIFGLRKRNQWFRRRLVAFLHHLIHAAFGSSINRRIIDYSPDSYR